MNLIETKTTKRYEKRQERVENSYGWAATDGPMAICQKYIEDLIDSIPSSLVPNVPREREMLDLLKGMPYDILALCILQAALNVAAAGKANTVAKARLAIGRSLEAEAFAQGLKQYNEELSDRLEQVARTRHGNIKYRRQAVRVLARKNDFQIEKWTPTMHAIAGNWALNLLMEHMGHVFTVIREDKHHRLGITAEAFEIAEAAIQIAVKSYPVYLPTQTKPVKWTDWDEGGPSTAQASYRTTFLRSQHGEVSSHVRAAFETKTMQPAIDALNRIQSVAWAIDPDILDLLQWTVDNGIDVAKMPPQKDIPAPSKSQEWEKMDENAKKAFKIKSAKIKKQNRGFLGSRLLLTEDIETAKRLLDQGGPFYTACNMDWRSRVYPLPHFNYQREDRVRALFKFHRGVKMTWEGMYWLKVHLASVGDFDKVSKKNYDERVKWVDEYYEHIKNVAKDPKTELWWLEADKPFQFVAACKEYVRLNAEGAEGFTYLPVVFDGSCSGLQHLSAMTHAAEGSYVNLTASDHPQDIYAIVAKRVNENLQKVIDDLEPSLKDRYLANLCLVYGVGRKEVKRAAMTFSYGSRKFGMATQLRDDLMRPLTLEVLEGTRDHHPFGSDEGFAASRFLARIIYDSIEEVIDKPAEAMHHLRSIAKAMAHENKPVQWTTPTGVPWINLYHDPNVKRISLWLMDRGVKVRSRMRVGEGYSKRINKAKAANGVAPNFVHALDATHLMMVVNGLAEEGINDIALVHDAFGVHAPQAEKLGRVLREQFVKLYTENDPLNDLLTFNSELMDNPNRLPAPLTKGPLDLNEVLEATYAFS